MRSQKTGATRPVHVCYACPEQAVGKIRQSQPEAASCHSSSVFRSSKRKTRPHPREGLAADVKSGKLLHGQYRHSLDFRNSVAEQAFEPND